ncbi:alpha-L-rhamnosidase-related protein [Micromonospora sp. BQ11]|uniref:alpha-L-rhamnosidase-related protein n=1 Tax=Micromonospora sp. BQ11 TaxID=3452212 RepID=UPI003F8A6454
MSRQFRPVRLLALALTAILLGNTAVHSPATAAPLATPLGVQASADFVTSARWIWTPSSATDQWVAFRKTIDLTAAPSSALTMIAVDSKYWLWVNGTLVTFEGGLKRGPNPNDTYYDERDIAPYLTAGRNTIAVLAWNFGKDSFSHKSSGQGGLLVQSDIVTAGTTTRLVSDASWRAVSHPGYQHETTGSQPNYRLAESNVYYDARNAGAMANWQGATFVDTGWATATDKGAAGAAPWNALVRRPIPAFRFSTLRDYTNNDSLPTQGTGATIVATLPSNLQVTPYLRVDAPAGKVIGIRTDHYNDGGESNVRASYVTTGGVQEFEALGWMSGTAVEYTVPAGVTIQALRYRESGYDTDFAGSFTSNDPFMNTLWTKAARTMYLNMRDTYFDCPTRERAQWWGDVVNQLKEGFYTFDTRSHDLGRKAINELTAWQKPGGQLYSPVPAGNWTSELPTQMLASVWSLWTFYTYTGDSATVGGAYPEVKRYLDLWSLDGDGLVNHRGGDWDWEDWGSNIDARVLDNAWYYLALDTAVKLAQLTGNTGDVAAFQARRTSIADNFNRVLWRSAQGEYRSPGYTGDTDDRGNALAVVAGLATPSTYPAIVNVLNNHRNASPYLEFYVLEALYLMGDPAAAEARMRLRYASQVSDPGYTLWELWSKGGGGTDNHGWNGGPLYVLSAYAAGVRPTQPGYTAYEVTPQPGGFTALDVAVPTVRGTIDVELNRPTANQVTLKVVSPAGSTATIGVPKVGLSAVTITANGTTVYAAGAATGSVAGLTYAGSDSGYVYFTAAPGTWTFDETGTGGSTGAGNIAQGKPVSSNNSLETPDWGTSRLTDGQLTSVAGSRGSTSAHTLNPDVSGAPIWVEVDLGADTDVDALRLFPRTDTTATGGGTPGFPVDFAIQARANGSGSYTTVRTVTGQPNPDGVPQTFGFTPVRARYLRVQATRLGAPAHDEAGVYYRLQLAELAVPLAHTVVTASDTLENGDWNRAFAFDGITTSVPGAKGYTSNDFTGPAVAGTWIELDLGVNRPISALTLAPRTDTPASGGGTANFPIDFTIATRPDGGGAYTTVHTVAGQPNPNGASQQYALTPTTARYVRVLVTRLGTPATDEPTRYRLQLAELGVG